MLNCAHEHYRRVAPECNSCREALNGSGDERSEANARGKRAHTSRDERDLADGDDDIMGGFPHQCLERVVQRRVLLDLRVDRPQAPIRPAATASTAHRLADTRRPSLPTLRTWHTDSAQRSLGHPSVSPIQPLRAARSEITARALRDSARRSPCSSQWRTCYVPAGHVCVEGKREEGGSPDHRRSQNTSRLQRGSSSCCGYVKLQTLRSFPSKRPLGGVYAGDQSAMAMGPIITTYHVVRDQAAQQG